MSQRLLLMGLPESGKTTFLAALWHLVESTEVDSTLRATTLPADATYLNQIREAWLHCHKMPRTTQSPIPQVTMDLVTMDDQEITLVVPDLSGESYRSQWTDRKCTPEYAELCDELNGVIVFIHPYKVIESQEIIASNQILAGQEETPDAEQQDSPPWEAKHSPTQVQVVELLQFLLARTRMFPLPIVIVISAWDLIERRTDPARGSKDTPASWLNRRLPLLDQFLLANPESLRSRIYGVSAQGGDIADEQQRVKLQAQFDASKRIQIVDAEGQSLERKHDLAAPIHWLLH